MSAQKKIIYISAIPAILLAFYCYNPFVLFFQADDFIHIPLSAAGKFLQQNSFRPICDLSIMIDYNIWGKTAWGYHLSNLLLHIIACILLFIFLKLLFKKYTGIVNSNFICWLSTVLFFLYAMHSEPVLWILGRSAILATIFSLLFLYCYIRRNDAFLFIVGFIFFWVLSLLTYESTWLLPLFTLLISISTIRQNKTVLKREFSYLGVTIIIFIIYLFIRDHYIHEVTGNYESGLLLKGDYTLLIRQYALLFIRSFVPAFINNKILIGLFVALTLIIVLLFFLLQKNKKVIAILFLCWLISLVPYISLGVDTNGTESERFLYFPTLIVVILIALIAGNSKSKKVYWLYPFLFIIHLAILFTVKENYRIAGAVNKQIAEALQITGSQKIVYAVDVPQAQNGAFILRQGLPQMMHWLSGKEPDTVIICSQRYELLPLQYPYKIIYSDTLGIAYNNKFIKPGKDTLLLKFTDAALFISK
ncbi:hypothetical protein FRZ67_05695 [Panacibacter ginsenosidivorans]|uniref:Glycosyltransferase RgtA/B/C/D-like domain-containing protein n=1 Tax=Panacibacter ginsenosidivorans TaxID=1813871 RepID=A0A5B8V5Y1_9BACT|nr:hypothetical protein [Panacibacter ginsenosidivorans]QEC66820.1 hypothetical protein FRZ67_05695 [Panacibacter ginsenosidivorans]